MYIISMVVLEYILEYEDMYEEFFFLYFGDVVYVRVKEVDIEVMECMVEYIWFLILGKFKNIVLGNDLLFYILIVNN